MFSPLQKSALASVFVFAGAAALAQNTSNTVPPVIDVHVHAMDESWGNADTPTCPNQSKFLASDPATKESPIGWSNEECTPKLYPAAKGEYMKDVIAEMKRMNVTAVVFGTPASVKKWMDADPGHVIPGTSFADGEKLGARIPIEELE